jgi:hypothetical protein
VPANPTAASQGVCRHPRRHRHRVSPPIIVGAIVIVSIGIRREERDFLRTGLISMTRRAPDRVSGGARTLTGLYVGQRTDSRPAAVRYEDTLV